MANAKFSLNLGFSLGDLGRTSSSSNNSFLSSFNSTNNESTYIASDAYVSGDEKNYTSSLTGAFETVNLPNNKLDGYLVDDMEAKMAKLKFTAFGSFLVKYGNNYTMCVDSYANADTQKGGLCRRLSYNANSY